MFSTCFVQMTAGVSESHIPTNKHNNHPLLDLIRNEFSEFDKRQREPSSLTVPAAELHESNLIWGEKAFDFGRASGFNFTPAAEIYITEKQKTITWNIIAELDRMEVTKVTKNKLKNHWPLQVIHFFHKNTCLYVFKVRGIFHSNQNK